MLTRLRITFFWLLFIVLTFFSSSELLAQVGCGGFDGAPQPTGGPQSLDNGQICLNKPGAPAQIRISAFNVADGNNPNNFAVEIDWDDGTARQVVSFGGPILVNNTGPHAYDIPSITHVFLPRPCATRPGAECAYRPRVFLRIAGTTCPAQFGTSPDFFRFNTDDQCSGDMELSETATGAVIFEVCAGASTTVTFTDRTVLNCLPPQELTGLNFTKRWRRFVYGTTNTITGGVLIGGAPVGFPFTPAGMPEISGEPLAISNPPFANNNTLAISIPATALVGEEFHIRMDYWNFCNQYPADPQVFREGIIRIVDQPVPPTPVNQVVCNGTNPLPNFQINFAAASSAVLWYRDNAGVPGAAVVNPNGSNNATFPSSAFPGGITNTTAGIYRMWASYRAQVGAGALLCESIPVAVTITIREAIPTPGPISGTSPICNGTNNVPFSVPIPASAFPFGGATEYIWDVVDASNVVVGDVTLTPSSGQGAIAQNITADFNIAGATFGAAPSIVRKIRVRRRYATAPNCQTPRAEFSVTVNRNTNAGSIAGGDNQCQGEILNPITWTPGVGNIVRWEVSVNGGPFGTVVPFGTSNPVNPTTLGLPVIGGLPTTYTYRAQIQNGNCALLATNTVVYTINPNADVANAGPNDAICVPAGALLYPALAGNTPGGAVTSSVWTQVSGPGTSAFGNANVENSSVTVTAPGIYVFRWSLDNGTCQSQDDVQISFGRDPAVPSPTPNGFCGLTGTLNAVAPVGGEIITWSFVAGPGTATITNANQIPASVTVSAFGAYTFELEFSSGSCAPQAANVVINFYDLATSTPEPDKTVCVDGNVLPGPIAPFPVTGTVGGGASGGRWEIASGSGTFTSSNAAVGSTLPAGVINDNYRPSAADFAAGTVTLRLVGVHPQAACGNTPNTVIITFDKKPADANVGLPFDVCGTTANLNADAPTEAGIGTWSAITAGPSITDPTDRLSSVSNLQFGANVFRWTVNSAQGSCAPSTEDLTITRTTAPVVVNISPNNLCETIANTGIAQSVDLAANYDNLITGGAGTVVTWFTNAARTIPVADVNDEDVSNGGIYYVRVSTTGPPPVCSSDGVVNFTINPKPFVANLNPSLCEEAFGGGVINNVDLTTFDDDVSLNAGNRTITWFTDSNVSSPVATPADVDNVTDGTTFYARVQNTISGCFNVAQVIFNVNAIPADNPIVGPNAVCLDPTDVIFFKVDQLKPNHTYQWNIPPTANVIGSTTDFFVLLQFPAVVPGGITIEVQETSPEGCPGTLQQLNITIEDNPGSLAITGPSEVCEFETDVVFTVPLFANLTYAWSVPPGASIILGQGTEEVRVNFGNIPGDVIVTPSTIVGCVGPTAMQPVTINRRPVMASLDKTVCSQEDAAITLTVAGGSEPATDYNYISRVLDAGIFTLNAPTTPPQNPVADNVIFLDRFENKTVIPLNVRYTVSGVSAKGCEGPSGFITLRVNPEPQLNPLLGRSICSGEETGITLLSAANTFPADRFIITSITVPAGVSAAVPGDIPIPGPTLYLDDVLFNNVWINTTGVNQVVSYLVLPYSTLLGCAGSPPTPVNVTVFPRTDVDPVVVTPLCNGDLLNVAFSSPNNADADFLWTVKTYDPFVIIGSPAAGLGNIVDMAITNTSLTQDGTVTFEVYGKNQPTEEALGGCPNPIQTFVVTILKSPIANAQNLTACSDSPGGNTYTADLKALEPSITPDAGTPDTRITWYRTDPRLGPATIIPDADLSAFIIGDAIPVFVEVEYIPTTCKKVVAIQYTVNPNVSVTSTLSDYNGFNLSCNGDNSGEIRIDVLTGSPVYAYRIDGGPFINAGATTYSFSSLAAGPHIVEVQDARGCTATQTIDLIEPPALVATLDIVQEISCFLGKDGIIRTVVTGGTGTYLSYLLLQTNTTDPNIDGIFEDLGAGSYNVRITDSNNCKIDSDQATLVQPTLVEINSLTVATDANGFNLSCRDALDGEIAVTFSGGNLPPDYTVTLTKASDPLNPSIVNTPTNSALFTNLGFGNYTVIVRDGKGCESLPASGIIVNPPPFSPGFVGINQSICVGDDPIQIEQLVPAFGGVGNYQYQWQLSLTGSTNDAEWIDIPGATNTTFDPAVLAQTTYFRRIVRSISARTGIACEILGKDNIVQVLINPLPVVSFNAPSEVCQGESFSLLLGMTGGTAPIEYDYSAGTTTFLNLIGTDNTAIPISNFQQPTTYTLLRVKDLNGCLAANVPQAIDVDIININPDFTILAPVAQCSGGTFTFQWMVEQDVKYTWIWSDGQQDIIDPGEVPLGVNTITHIFTAGSTESSTVYPVRLQAENALCAPQFVTKPITVFPTVVLNISPGDPILCSGESIRFVDQSRGVDVGKWYYQELGTTNQQDIRPGPVTDVTYVMTNTTTTNPIFYEVVYEASNNEGCSDEYRQEVKVYRGISADIINSPDPPDPFTGGASTVVFTNNSTPLDDTDFEYTWDFGDIKAVPATGTGIAPYTVDYFSPGIKDVILTAINIDARDVDNKTCRSSMTKKINIELPMLAAAFRATPLASCFPVDIVVENLSPGADTFLWELFDQNGLVTTSTLRNPVFRILAPGVYDIYLTASFLATGQTAMTNQKGIEVFDVPTALFEMRPNPLYVPDTELQTFNQSARASLYHWDFDDGTTSEEFEPRHLYKLAGKYNVTLVAGFNYGDKDVDGDGILDGPVICYDTAKHELEALDGGYIKLPNAFTPNPNGTTGGVPGNGTFNDVFLPIARGIEEFQMQIFDRWGNLLFESRDRNVGWDGYDRNARLMPAGVYVYKLTLRLSDGQRTTKVGDVTLIR